MTLRVIPLVLLVATTAHAQPLRLTNADLGRRHDLVMPVTGEVLAGLKAREFRLPMNYPERPIEWIARPMARAFRAVGSAIVSPPASPRRLAVDRPACGVWVATEAAAAFRRARHAGGAASGMIEPESGGPQA